jgi:hypothetical protein
LFLFAIDAAETAEICCVSVPGLQGIGGSAGIVCSVGFRDGHNSGETFGMEVFYGTVCRAAEAVCSVASLVDRGGSGFVFCVVF